jgi:hypothetical protein
MTPFRPRRKRLAVGNLVIAPLVLGLLLVPVGQRFAVASPELHPPARSNAVNLHLELDNSAATRVLAQDSVPSGAAQESDADMPKTVQPKKPVDPNTAAMKKEKPPEDPFAIVKDWPFWVIVGGVVLVGAAGYMLLRNSNDTPPCGMDFAAGCFGAR